MHNSRHRREHKALEIEVSRVSFNHQRAVTSQQLALYLCYICV